MDRAFRRPWDGLSDEARTTLAAQHYHIDFIPVQAWALIAHPEDDWRGPWEIAPMIRDEARGCLVLAELVGGYLGTDNYTFDQRLRQIPFVNDYFTRPLDEDPMSGEAESRWRILRDLERELMFEYLRDPCGFCPRVTFVDRHGRHYEP